MTNEELVDRVQHGINSVEYMQQLYIQNIGFIATVLKRYRYIYQSDYNSLPIIERDELMHEAYFGLVEAAKRFNKDNGNNFLAYAEHWIRQAVKRFIDNSGQIIRVPIHTQEKIHKYNQATGYYLRNFGREPETREYASWIGMSVNCVKKLQQYMYQTSTISLDDMVPGGDNESITFLDAVPADVNVEEDVVEKVAAAQLQEEMWDIVNQVLKDKKKIQIFRLRYIDNLTMEQIGDEFQLCKQAINETLKYGIKMLRHNSRTKNLGEELGLWSRDIPLDAMRVKRWAEDDRMVDLLRDKELKYAVNMGWINHGSQRSK